MKNKKMIILLLGVFLFDLILVLTGNVETIDTLVYQCIHSLHNPQMTNIMIRISYFSGTNYILILNILICIYVLITKKRETLLIVFSSLLSVSINSTFEIQESHLLNILTFGILAF